MSLATFGETSSYFPEMIKMGTLIFEISLEMSKYLWLPVMVNSFGPVVDMDTTGFAFSSE